MPDSPAPPEVLSPINHLVLHRVYLPQETVGILVCGWRYFVTMEDAWRHNERFISCIPEGKYKFHKGHNSNGVPVIHIKGVVGRDGIQIHIGNDHADTMGCLLVGNSFTKNGIGDSKNAVEELLDSVADFGTIEIRGQA